MASVILEACLGSVGPAYENIEVVVADQASTDRSIEIVQSFADQRVRLLPKPTEQLDLHANWARGLAATTGELVKIVCHDDLLLPHCSTVQVELLRRYPTAVLVCCRRKIIDDEDRVLLKARGLGHLAGSRDTRVIECSRASASMHSTGCEPLR